MKFNVKRLNQIQQEKNIPWLQLCKIMDISYDHIWKLKEGKSEPKLRDINKFVKALGLKDAKELIIF